MNTRDIQPVAAAREVLTFGPFQLDLAQRVLREGATAIHLNKRALELLIALVQRPGQVVAKNELLERGWPGSDIQEGVLRVHIAALRKVLGDRAAGTRFIENVSGRGYRFVVRVRPQRGTPKRGATAPAPLAPSERASGAQRADNLPALLTRVLGRSEVVGTLAQKLKQRRFVSVIGPGGIGKTTVAVALAGNIGAGYADGVRFLDLSLLTESRLVPGALGELVGLESVLVDPTRRLLCTLRQKSLLIVIDNCEHLAAAVADLAERVFNEAPRIHLLATSRQPLRAYSEHVFRLAPLQTPPELGELTREDALAFPAIQLFVERAMASLDTFELSPAEVPLVAQICRRLDGNPLAIELAAARVDILGVQGLAARLGDGLQILAGGRRTAAARHQSVFATLDWSYNLLCPSEQALLRRVAVFNGSFDFDSANTVAADATLPQAAVCEHLASLAAKSLLAVDTSGDAVLYRLPQYQRDYALGKLASSGEETWIRRRHVEMWHTCGLTRFYSQRRRGAQWVALYGRNIDDIRAALQWCCAPESDIPVGTTLSLLSMWLEFVLVSEYDGQLEDAIARVTTQPSVEQDTSARLEQLLSEIILKQKGGTPGPSSQPSLDPAALERRTALWGLWAERLVCQNDQLANVICAHFPTQPGAGPVRLVDRMLMVAHHFAGRQSSARGYAERLLQRSPEAPLTAARSAALACDPRSVLSQVLWLQGFADQAVLAAHESVAEALTTGDSLLICYTLRNAFVVSIYTGDLEKAGAFATALRERAAAQPVEHCQVWARGAALVLAIKSGERAAPAPFHLSPEPLRGPHSLDGLGAMCESLVSQCAIVRAEHGRGGWCAAETLRVKGERLLEESCPDCAAAAEKVFRLALQKAREQGVLSFELRVAMSLARLWRSHGRSWEGHELLSGVYQRFVEGFGTADLRAAHSLLTELAAGQMNSGQRH